jgi:hypothetical protein
MNTKTKVKVLIKIYLDHVLYDSFPPFWIKKKSTHRLRHPLNKAHEFRDQIRLKIRVKLKKVEV